MVAFSMSSMHMKTTIALRRTRTPTAPMVNRIIDSEWLMIAMRRLVVDFSSSMNSTTSEKASSRSPRLIGQGEPEVIEMVNSGSVKRWVATVEANPPISVMATRL